MYVHEATRGNTPHLIWKDDGNAVGGPTPIWIQQLAEDGLSLRGNRHLLITNNASSWEGGVVEGPTLTLALALALALALTLTLPLTRWRARG